LVPTFICLAPMNVANKFRGLHGIISGTRVISMAWTDRSVVSLPIIKAHSFIAAVETYGDYETSETVGESRTARIVLGLDRKLNREVWIVINNSQVGPPEARINCARATRLRWLAGGVTNEKKRWDVLEAVRGVPVQILLSTQHNVGWKYFRTVMLELARELHAALNDRTMPEELSVAQIWLDQDGHAKLLDWPLVHTVAGDFDVIPHPETSPRSEDHRAVTVYQDLGALIGRSIALPESAVEFLRELQNKPKQVSTLIWAAGVLEKMSKQLADLTWDSRVGILGASLGFEAPVYFAITLTSFLIMFWWMPFSFTWTVLMATAMSLAPPLLAGVFFRGGPVFRLMGVDVCKRKGGPATPLTCAFRNAISWLPMISAAGLFLIPNLLANSSNKARNSPDDTIILIQQHQNLLIATVVALATMLMTLVLVIGLIWSVRNPHRGLQDLVSGTRLMPK
jgi:hypothetical protein